VDLLLLGKVDMEDNVHEARVLLWLFIGHLFPKAAAGGGLV
tara:strand:- start:145 stop:267 length:123 start_codon:yes stop_codon:yes gene_type:complete